MDWEKAVSAIVIFLLISAIKLIFDTRKETYKINGRLGKLETWKADHIALSKERDNKLHGRIKGVEDRIRT